MEKVAVLLLVLRASHGQTLTLTHQDDFTGSEIDTSLWEHEISAWGGGNWEFQIYANEAANSYVSDGKLTIKPTLTADLFGEDWLYNGILNVTKIWGRCDVDAFYGCYRDAANNMLNPILSAKLKSKFAFKYGKVEIVARMPQGDWIWPALWMLPRDWVYGEWPRSGEVDLVESRGNENLSIRRDSLGTDRMSSTMHWGTAWHNNQWEKTNAGQQASSGTFADTFHNYTLLWNENGISTWVDGISVLDHPTPTEGYYSFGGFNPQTDPNPWTDGGINAPFDQEFYLILNVAIGGVNGYFPDNARNRPYRKPWLNTSPQAAQDFWEKKAEWYDATWGSLSSMEVESVRVWEYL